ncbi:hypothetical protein PF008_g18886 [Phytophthora fragariae]|uniref:Cyclic nucleotide-binding domain-containing protein n=1 Tax=Phytophthora fragariae TaxID=53985 RepID=A0A6G0R409_9STRA|nr:hypothetical protein PF008_g18886 [Phytophthora fragariae]
MWSLATNSYKMKAKDESHEEMMQRFQLRRLSSDRGSPSKFGRGKNLVIDKATGTKRRKARRLSLHRLIRKIISPKSRRKALQGLTSPITPKSWTSTVHGIVLFIVYHFQLLYLPFSPSYYPNGSFLSRSIQMTLESVFLVDLVLNFNTAFVRQGALITSRSEIASNYICKWFVFDLLSALPLQIIHCIFTRSFGRKNSTMHSVQLTLMVLRLLRVTIFERGVLLSRVMRVANHIAEWLRYSRYSHLLGIAQLMWLVLLIAHYMACFWHVVTTHSNANASLNQNHSVLQQYVADYYYAVSLIQGQGGSFGTWGENLYSSVAIIVGSVILAIVFGNVAMLVSNFNANTTNYHRKMEAVYATMDKLDLPLKLRERVNEYYTHVWLEYEALDGNINKFQQELTHTLRIEIGLYKFMNLVVKIPFWEDCTPDFLTQIVLSLGVRVYMPDDYVVRRREIGSEMMMINMGYCILSKPIRSVKKEKTLELATYAAGDHGANVPVLSPEYIEKGAGVDSADESGNERDSNDSSSDESPREMGYESSTNIRRMSGSTFELQGIDLAQFGRELGSGKVLPNGSEHPRSNKFRICLNPGTAFGEMSLLMNYKRTANIRALTFVEMCVLDRCTFQRIISRYPEDRRRVLTKMLESCIEKKEIPFPWENIIEAVSNKRRNNGCKDFSRASIIATMTASEAARILVEAIDVNAPDESIKYGFQSFDEGFVEGPSLRRVNSVGAKIRDTLQRTNSGVRLFRSYSRRYSNGDTHRSSTTSNGDTENESDISGGSSWTGGSVEKTMECMMQLLHSMADNISRLQQDVGDLKRQKAHCKVCGTKDRDKPKVTPTATTTVTQSTGVNGRSSTVYDRSAEVHALALPSKEDPENCGPRKLSLVAAMAAASLDTTLKNRLESSSASDHQTVHDTSQENGAVGLSSSEEKHPKLKRPIHSAKFSDGTSGTSRSAQRDESLSRLESHRSRNRSPDALSSRAKDGRQPMMADLLWKRSNADGDLLKHSPEERNAARKLRQLRPRSSLPSGVSPIAVACADGSIQPEPDSNDHDTRRNRKPKSDAGLTEQLGGDRQQSFRKPPESIPTAPLSTDPRRVMTEE